MGLPSSVLLIAGSTGQIQESILPRMSPANKPEKTLIKGGGYAAFLAAFYGIIFFLVLPSGCHMEEQVLPSGCHMEEQVLPSGCHMEERVLPSGCHMEERVLPSGCHMVRNGFCLLVAIW